MKIGFVGLGKMGMPMARNLLAAGKSLVVYDICPEQLEAIASHGATIAASAREIANQAELVLISLPTPVIVEAVIHGADGVQGGRLVRTVIDLSTSGARVSRKMSDSLLADGVAWIDAPVSGGIGGATAGTLAIMVSGPAATFAQVEVVLQILGRTVFVGEQAGLAQTMKLVNNMVSGGALALTAEAMAMGAKAGLRPEVMIEVLNAGSGRNTATADKFPKSVLTGRFDYGFATSLMLKDATLFLEEAEAMGLSLRTANSVRQLWFETLIEIGPGDFTTIAQLIERRAGVALRAG